MKKKVSGVCQERTNARGFEQINSMHFLRTETLSPMVNAVTIEIIFFIANNSYARIAYF